MDNQVKIRGVRVELDEIEARLRAIGGVKQAIVKKGAYSTGEECLIAYYQAEDGFEIADEALRSALRVHLPEAIVPNIFIRVEAFSVGENGKLDRKALPDIASPSGSAGRDSGAYRDDTEEAVGRAWSSVLSCQGDVPPDRNFFDAGGNSLSLLSLRSVLEQEFGKEIRIVDLFQNPTISGMASLVGGGSARAESAPAAVATADRARLRNASLMRMRRGHDAD
jgi:arthrofactin-type cyclic lipopeptide synthetase B